jgi:hypothetical protein
VLRRGGNAGRVGFPMESPTVAAPHHGYPQDSHGNHQI